ncbi:DAHL domain-containing protein [Sphingomonas arantia]
MLTWLLFMGFNHEDHEVQDSLRGLDAYMTNESALHRDVLSARAGLLNNYDPLDVDLFQMTAAAEDASRSALTPDERRDIGGLKRTLSRQNILTEQFKTTNALVRNSLAYFAAYSGRVAEDRFHPDLQRDVNRLSSAMLALNLNNSQSARDEVRSAIASLARSCARKVCDDDVHNLLAHARLLRDQLPVISRTIEQLIRSGGSADVTVLSQYLLKRQMRSEATATQFRIILYLVSLLLLYLLVRWGIAMHRQSAMLERQVAVEHSVSRLSTRMIGADPQTIIPSLHEALGDLADALGAEGAWFLDATDRCYGWSAAHSFTCEEIAAVRDRGAKPQFGSPGVVRILLREETGVIRRAAAVVHLGELCCISSPHSERWPGMLIFGFPEGACAWRSAQLSVLRTALDALSLSLEHASLEDERRRLEAQLEHARRMETVGAFASGIAHNFNNLLGAMSGQLEMVEETSNLSVPMRDHIQQIRLSTERGQQLIQALLSYGRRRDRAQEIVSLDELVEESRNLAMAGLDPAYQLTFEGHAGNVEVLADPVQLQQVLLNMCHNAAQSMPLGGEVHVRTGTQHLTQGLKALTGRIEPGAYATISIQDHGCGMDEQLQQKIFEPFFTTKPSGTGLGLSTARDILLEQGGALTLDSRVGVGTSMTIWLPRMLETASLPETSDAIVGGSGETILYVSPDGEQRVWGEDLLAALGYEPVGAASYQQALALLRTDQKRFDAIIVGGQDPTDELRQFSNHVRTLAPEIARILAVSRPEVQDPRLLLTAEITAVLQFPLDARELAAILSDILDDRRSEHHCIRAGRPSDLSLT